MSPSVPSMWRPGRFTLLGSCACLLFALMWVRSVAEARVALARAEISTRGSSYAARRLALADAVRWGAPLNWYASRATEQLLALAQAEERDGREREALASYRALRGSLLSSGGIVQPHADVLGLADSKIAALSAHPRLLKSGERKTALARQERVARQLASSARRPPPRLLALGGFVAWACAAFYLAASGFDADGRVRRRRVLRASFGVLVGFGCFCVGLWGA